MQISLAYRQKKILESRHKMCRDKNKCDRLKAIMLSDEGYSEGMISQLYESINQQLIGI
ncbi:MAG: hypothetical protein KAH18_04635 [Psychromonas sp.]|nr:hypothetical protein [Psychromonas sp.]